MAEQNTYKNISATKRAFSADTDVSFRTHIGGQALIEGVMMRGRYNWAVAIREPSGNIYTEEHELKRAKKKNSWLSWPIIRGCVAFIDSLVLGYKALSISADHAYDLEEDEGAAQDSTFQYEDTDQKEGEHAASHNETSAKNFEVAPSNEATHVSENEVEDKQDTADQVVAGNEVSAKKVVLQKEEQPTDVQDKKQQGLGGWIVLSLLLGLVLGIAVFIVLPAWLSNLVFGENSMNNVSWNLFDGLVRVVIFILYIAAIGFMPDIKRMFSYHGAEHKTIHAFEHGAELIPPNCMKYPRLHVRCGTAFLIMVMIIAIFVYTALGKPINALVDMTGITDGVLRFVLIMLTRIILMPLIAGFSYEISVRWAGRHPDNMLVKILLWPGLQMQRLTTKEPDEGMLECAIAATNLVIEREEKQLQLEKEQELKEQAKLNK